VNTSFFYIKGTTPTKHSWIIPDGPLPEATARERMAELQKRFSWNNYELIPASVVPTAIETPAPWTEISELTSE